MAQQTFPTGSTNLDGSPDYRRYLPLLVLAAAVIGFLAAPWPLAEKSHAVLHGLCAQTPSHTILLGSQPLPFDARMTGIYSGLSIVMLVIGWRTRFRFAALPAWPVIAALALAVLAMAIDGFNSFFLDLGMWHPYTPQNWLRLVTGAGAGLALGATISYMIATSLWDRPQTKARIVTWRDLGITAAAWICVAALILSGWSFLYSAVTLFLILSAVIAVCTLAYLMLVLGRATNNRHQSAAQIGGEGAIGVLLGLIAIAMLACGRFALEYWIGIPTPQ